MGHPDASPGGANFAFFLYGVCPDIAFNRRSTTTCSYMQLRWVTKCGLGTSFGVNEYES